MRGVGLALSAVLLLGAAACGGDGDTAETDPSVEAVTTLRPATSATTVATTTAAPSTTAPPSSTTTTTTTTTTLLPTTTQDPTEAFAAEVEAAFLESWALYDEALADPTSDKARNAALAAAVEPRATRIESAIAEYRERGYSVLLNDENPSSLIVESPPAALEDSDTTMQLVACLVDTSTVVERGAGPNGSDAIVDDGIVAFRLLAQLQSVADRWRLAAVTILDEWPEAQQCSSE